MRPAKNNVMYKPGESWIEETGFTYKEFLGALKKLEDKDIVSHKTNAQGITFYDLNIRLLDSLLKNLYSTPDENVEKSRFPSQWDKEYADSDDKTYPQELTKEELTGDNLSPTDKQNGDFLYTGDYTETTQETTESIPPIPKKSLKSQVIDYFNEYLGKSIKKIPSNYKYIEARINEGNYTLEDFKYVIENKHAEWGNSPDWADGTNPKRLLRVETLFGTKFDTYLNEPDRRHSSASSLPPEPDASKPMVSWGKWFFGLSLEQQAIVVGRSRFQTEERKVAALEWINHPEYAEERHALLQRLHKDGSIRRAVEEFDNRK